MEEITDSKEIAEILNQVASESGRPGARITLGMGPEPVLIFVIIDNKFPRTTLSYELTVSKVRKML